MNRNEPIVFLSHNSDDKPQVERLARLLLSEHGVNSWLDIWNLIPGQPWQEAIEQALMNCDAIAVCVGSSGMGPWQNREMRLAIDRQVNDSEKLTPIIPVLLPGAVRGDRGSLPSFLADNTWVEFRDSLENTDDLARLIAGIRGEEPGDLGKISGDIPPYRGLEAFEIEHARLFFGREALTEWLVDAVRPQSTRQGKSRFIAVVGPSGSGKSSLVQAGLLARIKHDVFPSSGNWPLIQIRADGDPLKTLAIALDKHLQLNLAVDNFRSLLKDLKDNTDSLHLTVGRALHESPERRLLLFVDQFEEIFATDDDSRLSFINNLMAAAADVTGQVIVVITMRSDFYGRCAAHPTLANAISSHQFLVGPMSDKELQRAIERPAYRVGVELEAGLAERLISDFREQPSSLPLLQFALEQIWNYRLGKTLTNSAYDNLGGLGGALDTYASKVYEEDLNTEQRKACKQLFLRLIQPGEGTEDTKRRVDAGTLNQDSDTADVLRILSDSRLITMGEFLHESSRTVEVAHEALIRHWSTLRIWLEQDREAHRTQTALSKAAGEWDAKARDDSYLYIGTRLKLATEWRDKYPQNATPIEIDFLDRSREREVKEEKVELLRAQELAQEQRARAESERLRAEEQLSTSRSLRYRAWSLVVATAAAIGFALYGLYQADKANLEAENAKEQGLIADTMASVARREQRETLERLARNNWRSAIESRDRWNEPILAAHWFARASASPQQDFANSARLAANGMIRGAQLTAALAHDEEIVGAIPMNNPSRVLTWQSDGRIRIWDVERESVVVVLEHGSGLSGVRTSEDESLLLSWGSGTVVLWDVVTARQLLTLKTAGYVSGARFDATESRILSWGYTVDLWEIESGEQLVSIPPPKTFWPFPKGARINSDSSLILSWEGNGKLSFAADGSDMMPLRHDIPDGGGLGVIEGAVFSHDDSRIMTWSTADTTIRLWDIAQRAEIARLPHDSVFGARFNLDGSRVLSWSTNGTIRLWDSATGSELWSHRHGPTGGTSCSCGARFSRDESRILVYGTDRVTLVDAETGSVYADVDHKGVTSASLSPDESRILSSGSDGRVRVWKVESRAEVATLTQSLGTAWGIGRDERLLTNPGTVNAFFLGHSSRIATWGSNDSLRIWKLGDPAELMAASHDENASFREGWGHVKGAEFSKDESLILSWGDDDSVRVWDVSERSEIAAFTHSNSDFFFEDRAGASISVDASRVISWSDNGVLRLWAVDSGQHIATLDSDGESVVGAAFSADGSKILSWSKEGPVRSWSALTGSPIGELYRGTAIEGLAVSLDGLAAITWDQDRLVRKYDLSLLKQVGTISHEAAIQGAKFSGNALYILSWSEDGVVRLSNSATLRSLGAFSHASEVLGATVSFDGRRVVTWGEYGMKMWDVQSATSRALVETSDYRAIEGAKFFPDASGIISWGTLPTKLWNSADGIETVAPLPHRDGAEFGLSNSLVLIWSKTGGEVELWETTTGTKAVAFDHRGAVQSAVFDDDQNRILSWGHERAIRLWNVSYNPAEAPSDLERRLQVHTGTRLTPLGEFEILSSADWNALRLDFQGSSPHSSQ